ncbi:hypothetical protein ACGFY7_36280 [Streptomyces prunicolor]
MLWLPMVELPQEFSAYASAPTANSTPNTSTTTAAPPESPPRAALPRARG